MTYVERPESRNQYQVQVGHMAVQVEGTSHEQAIEEARRRFCRDMPRLWDVIQGLDVCRFRVQMVAYPSSP